MAALQLTVFFNFPSFSEGLSLRVMEMPAGALSMVNFPSFSEGLSLRAQLHVLAHVGGISLPFRRDFH